MPRLDLGVGGVERFTSIAQPQLTNDLQFAIDAWDFVQGDEPPALRLRGWLRPDVLRERPPASFLVLASDAGCFSLPLQPALRADLAHFFKDDRAQEYGIFGDFDLSGLPQGVYRVGLLQSGMLEGNALRTRQLKTVAQLDREIKALRRAEQRSFSEWAGMREEFSFFEDIGRLPSDPYSDRYKEGQLALYTSIAGTNDYEPWRSEPIAIDVERSIDPHPFPFSTKDALHIGNHMTAIGHILCAMGDRSTAGKSLLEYGCGTGFTSIFLAASGYNVTAVDINNDALKVAAALAAARKLSITTFNGTFGQVPDETSRFDTVLFYEAFHHCLDFLALLNTLKTRLAPGGRVVFAGEPVFSDFPKPWGLRLDGAALWEIRTKGWLELGFREDFFYDMLKRTGWTVEKHSGSMSPDIYIARPAYE